MLPSFFEVTPVELWHLGAEPAVAVLREMILAEVINLGIPISAVDVPYPITTSDGGVDAIVVGTPRGPGNGIVFAPRTSYQVKTGEFLLTATSLGLIEALLIRPSAIDARKNTGRKKAGRKKAKVEISGKAHRPEDIRCLVPAFAGAD